MSRIKKPTPPEHILIVDTNILWHEDKSCVVAPSFTEFWETFSGTFPMNLIIPEVVHGELLFQQTTSALKQLERANRCLDNISGITEKKYSHRVNPYRIKSEVAARFEKWLKSNKAEVKITPTESIDWRNVLERSIWRQIPFTEDEKNPKNEKGFRDIMILETVDSICKFYSQDSNIAFICNDFALRTAANEKLGKVESFSTYESLDDFVSFIELTKRNLTNKFVKSILGRASKKFYSSSDNTCLAEKDDFYRKLRKEYESKIENPNSRGDILALGILGGSAQYWEHKGREQTWIAKPQFVELEGEHLYHWLSKVTIVRLYERESTGISALIENSSDRRLMVLTIDVFWKATVGTDGRFFSCEIESHSESSYTFNTPTTEELERYGIEKKAEQDGPIR